MNISTKGRYGLEAVVDIARHGGSDKKIVALKSVSERQGVSQNYLQQIITTLRKAGIVDSVRGSDGGYFLARPAEEITVGSVLRPLEGTMAPADCVVNNDDPSCNDDSNCSSCSTRSVWHSMFSTINQVVDNITIADLLKEQESPSG
ncbi:MAG: Rrf2 family transcriptional regulator [Defluviitaleaceae bacterium]|nr:Rrf2 family transcriptional regulator [Defluviitaleaceae bacterium]